MGAKKLKTRKRVLRLILIVDITISDILQGDQTRKCMLRPVIRHLKYLKTLQDVLVCHIIRQSFLKIRGEMLFIELVDDLFDCRVSKLCRVRLVIHVEIIPVHIGKNPFFRRDRCNGGHTLIMHLLTSLCRLLHLGHRDPIHLMFIQFKIKAF